MNRNWTREELLLAFNLYCKLPFGKFDKQNPEVIALSEMIDRTPSAVAMKLVNFASLDPYHQERGIKGLSNVSKADKAIWQEVTSGWNNFAEESETLLEAHLPIASDKAIITERESIVKVRRGQRFFRNAVLADYHYTCCICGLPIAGLLIASHIIAWRDREDTRLNPHNGLSLCALHDKAFDQGWITIHPDYHVMISSAFKELLPNEAITLNFEAHHTKQITLPEKFKPEPLFLEYHNLHYFKP